MCRTTRVLLYRRRLQATGLVVQVVKYFIYYYSMDRVVLSKRPVVIYHDALHMLCTNSRRYFLLFVDPPYTSTQVCYLLLFFRLGFSTASGFATSSSLPNSVATPPSSTNFRFLSAVCSSHFFLSKRVHVCEKI